MTDKAEAVLDAGSAAAKLRAAIESNMNLALTLAEMRTWKKHLATFDSLLCIAAIKAQPTEYLSRDSILEEAANACEMQANEPECHERATYCADAIRALKAQPAPTEALGDVLAAYTKWMHDSSKYPHSDDTRHPHDAFKAGAEWAQANTSNNSSSSQLSGNAGELASSEVPKLGNLAAQGEDSARLDWISVDDQRKPALGQMVLLFVRTLTRGWIEDQLCEGEGTEIAMGDYRLSADGEVPYFDCYTSPMSDSDWITHWMPLPAAPQPQEQS